MLNIQVPEADVEILYSVTLLHKPRGSNNNRGAGDCDPNYLENIDFKY